MNDIQKKELELLKIFISICNQCHLKYYMVCGSALGTVKYGGFIPWDDDIDVALPRKDYEKFLEIAPNYLPDWIFIQNYRTEKDYPQIGTKLRNNNTTYLEKDFKKLKINQGIFIDIFPLDGYPKNKAEIKKFERKKRYLYRRRFTKLYSPVHKDVPLTVYSILYKLFGLFSNTQKACYEYDCLVRSFSLSNSEFWCNFANSMSKKEYSPQSYYGEGVEMSFEGLRVIVPQDYDSYLTLKYGDYKKDLPEDKKRPTHHYFVDINTPYTHYLEGENV